MSPGNQPPQLSLMTLAADRGCQPERIRLMVARPVCDIDGAMRSRRRRCPGGHPSGAAGFRWTPSIRTSCLAVSAARTSKDGTSKRRCAAIGHPHACSPRPQATAGLPLAGRHLDGPQHPGRAGAMLKTRGLAWEARDGHTSPAD